jgi:hypothetical protein
MWNQENPCVMSNTRLNFKRYASLTTGSDYVNRIGLETVEMGMLAAAAMAAARCHPVTAPIRMRHHVMAGFHLHGGI